MCIIVIIILVANPIGASYCNATDRNKGFSFPRAPIACVAACQGAQIAPPETNRQQSIALMTGHARAIGSGSRYYLYVL
jgi:hypothetical protein